MAQICFGIVGDLAIDKFIRKKEINQLENFYLKLIELYPDCKIFYFGHTIFDYIPNVVDNVQVIDQNNLNNTPREYLINYAATNKINGISMLAFECIANYSHVTNFIGYSNKEASASYIDYTDLRLEAALKTVTEKTKELAELHQAVTAAHNVVEQGKAAMSTLAEQNKALLKEIRKSVATPVVEQERNLKKSIIKEQRKESAYITFLSTDNYIYYVLALYDSWRNTNSKYKLYCAVTDNVSASTIAILDKIGLPHILINNAPYKELAKQMTEANMVGKYINALSKLGIFGLAQFEKLVYLDSDLVIYQNIDDLFTKPDWSAVEDCLPVHIRPEKYKIGESSFCSGLLVFSPSKGLEQQIIATLPKLPVGVKWHDQAILAYLHQDWMQRPELHLPCEYDLLIASREDVLNKYYELGGSWDKIKVAHYVSYKNAPYTSQNKFIFNDNVYQYYYDYYVYINQIIDKYKLNIEKSHLENIYAKSKSNEWHLPKDPIDLVVPYVDSSDPIWVDLYNKYSMTPREPSDNTAARFRGQGEFFRLFFRGIAKNMPWIHKVFLLVQSKSQVPKWINEKNVKVITHDEFIPQEFLPTFNSCTIEQFLWNIPGLSERFIYVNDDFYALNYLHPSSFFADSGKIRFNIQHKSLEICNTTYDKQCFNGYVLASGSTDKYAYKSIDHIFRPYYKSMMKACFDEHKQEIINSISMFRTPNNINCYVYSMYLDCLNIREDTTITNNSAAAHLVNTSRLYEIANYDTICLNDRNDINIYNNALLVSVLLQKLPATKCKYESTDYMFKSVLDGKNYAYGVSGTYLYF